MGQRYLAVAAGQFHFGGQLTAGKIVSLGNGLIENRLTIIEKGRLGQKQAGKTVYTVLATQGSKARHHALAVSKGILVEPQAEEAIRNIVSG